MIYLDCAATSFQKPPEVGQAVLQSMQSIGNAGRGAHAPTLKASRLLYGAREKLAGLFGIGDASRIAFTCNATEALNLAIQGLFVAGDHVITTECEHNSVLRPLYLMESRGVEVTHLRADLQGRLDYDSMEKMLRKNTRAVVVTHASNVTGNVTDLGKVSDFVRRHRLLLIVDASQTAGVLPIHVQKDGIDILCFTGHKSLLGPQGIGGIYVREGVELRPFKVGGSGIHSYDRDHPREMPTALEAGTQNGHGIAGLYAALSYLEKTGTEAIYQHEQKLMRRFLEGVRRMPGVRLYGDYDADCRAAIVSLNIGNYDSASVADWLWEDYEICVRAGAHCAPLMHRALGTEEQGAVRFSFSHFNTEEEIDLVVNAVGELADGV